ncbi:MAG: hypothetical protein JW909_05810 [Planctomycetes bacterium]|nr:hypothetical protein [Planctomycetota bacterium]
MNNPSLAALFLVVGAVIIAYSVGRILNRNRSRKVEDLRSLRESMTGEDAGKDDPSASSLSDVSAAARDLSRHLDSRMQALRVLIADADRRIELLSSMTGPPAPSMRSTVSRLAASGMPFEQIARETGLTLAEVGLALHLAESEDSPLDSSGDAP